MASRRGGGGSAADARRITRLVDERAARAAAHTRATGVGALDAASVSAAAVASVRGGLGGGARAAGGASSLLPAVTPVTPAAVARGAPRRSIGGGATEGGGAGGFAPPTAALAAAASSSTGGGGGGGGGDAARTGGGGGTSSGGAAASSSATDVAPSGTSTTAPAAAAAATGGGGKYATRVDAVEDLLRSDTVGLVSAADFRAKRQYLERCAADVAEVRAAAARREEVDARQARLAKRADGAKLSFALDDEEEEEDDDDDDGDDGGGGVGMNRSGRGGVGGSAAGVRRNAAGVVNPSVSAPETGGSATPSAGVVGDGGGGAREGTPGGAGVPAAADATATAFHPAEAARQGLNGGLAGASAAALPFTGRGPGGGGVSSSSSAAALGAPDGAPPPAKRVKVGKNPTADTSFLPDRSRTVAAAAERARLAQAWHNEQAAAKAEPVTITYSYWDGRGHRRTLTCAKGTTIGKFLALVQTQFHALRAVSPDQLMFVKEDLIIPSHYSFHDFIVRKARGKSGPLFTFDVVEDVRLVNDASVEKADAHAGKVVERRWYERNRHIFPASRWEPWDPNKSYEQYTIHGA
ncbi:hypothetical protein MMPV_003469 [Pyropia vietnamensis]